MAEFNRTMRQALALAITVGTLALSQSAAADLYFGVGSGRATVDDRMFGASDDFTADDTSEHYFVGFTLGRHARFEIGRADLGVLEDTVTLGGVPTRTTVAAEGNTYSLLFSERVADDLSLYLRAGTFEWERKVQGVAGARQRGGNGLFGLGLSLRVTDDFTLRAEYQRFEMGDANLDVPTLAVAYHF